MCPTHPIGCSIKQVIKPSGLVKPHVITDNPEPHRFAMLVGAVFNGVATIALLAGAPALGMGFGGDRGHSGKPELLGEFLRRMLDVLPI